MDLVRRRAKEKGAYVTKRCSCRLTTSWMRWHDCKASKRHEEHTQGQQQKKGRGQHPSVADQPSMLGPWRKGRKRHTRAGDGSDHTCWEVGEARNRALGYRRRPAWTRKKRTRQGRAENERRTVAEVSVTPSGTPNASLRTQTRDQMHQSGQRRSQGAQARTRHGSDRLRKGAEQRSQQPDGCNRTEDETCANLSRRRPSCTRTCLWMICIRQQQGA